MESTGMLVSDAFFLLMLGGRTGRDYTGISRSGRLINAGVAAGMLDDLSLAGRLTRDGAGRVVADSMPTGDATLDVLLATIAEAGKPRSTLYWIRKLWNAPCVERVGGRLAARGIIARTERRALGIFKVKHYALVDGAARERVVDRLRAVVLDDVEPDRGTRMLLSLLPVCDGLRWILTPAEQRQARQRIAAIVAGDAAASAIRSYLAIGTAAADAVGG